MTPTAEVVAFFFFVPSSWWVTTDGSYDYGGNIRETEVRATAGATGMSYKSQYCPKILGYGLTSKYDLQQWVNLSKLDTNLHPAMNQAIVKCVTSNAWN